jgi:N-acetylglucosamine transport system substrate-binding protein
MPVAPNESSNLSRRKLLGSAVAAGLMATPAAGLLAACATSTDSGNNNQGGGTKTAANPFGMPEDGEVNVVIFNGGYGDRYAKEVHEPLFTTAFPRAKIVHKSSQAISTELAPLFAAGNPPEFVNNSGEKSMDFGQLVAEGQLMDLTELLDAPSVHDPNKKVRETLVPGTVEVGSFDGKPLVLYYVSTVFGIWYDGKLFKDRGWTAPKDWDAFVALCNTIKAAGITPYAYAGANAAYYQWNVILTGAAKLGGAEVLEAIDNLQPNAWTNESVKQSATMWAEIGSKFMNKAHEGLRHTEVQLQQNQGKVAFYPSGDWLENEQKADTPAGFEYQLMPVPMSNKLSAAGVRATAGEGYFVSAKSKNPRGGLEYMRRMLSLEGGKGFTNIVKAPTVVLGASDGFAFPPGVSSSQAALKAAGKDVVNLFFDGDYKDLDQEARAATNELMFGRINADAWATRIQRKADAIAADSSIKKFKR